MLKINLTFRQFHEIFQQLQADLLAFLRVKLRGENIVAPDGGSKAAAVIRAGRNDGFVHRLRIKAVNEINVAPAGNAAIERTIGLHDVELVPADLRDFQSGLFRETDNAALKNSESGGAGIEFFASFKQCLITDADAEKRFAGPDEIARGFEQFLFAQGVDAIVERADTGQNHRAGIADLIRPLHDAHVRAGLEQRFVDAAQVAGAVVEQGDHNGIYLSRINERWTVIAHVRGQIPTLLEALKF